MREKGMSGNAEPLQVNGQNNVSSRNKMGKERKDRDIEIQKNN